MSIGRTIVALLVALSVALLPAAGGAGASAKPSQAAGMSMEDMADCCPPKANPCEKDMGDCGAMATCVLKCFGFVGTSAVIIFPSTFAEMTAPFAACPFSS